MLLVYGFAYRSLPTAPSLMTYNMPNLTTNHIDANGNLILPGSHTTGTPTTNQTGASINRNSSNSSTSTLGGGDTVPLDPNAAVPLEPNRTIINTTTNRTKPLYTATSSGGTRLLQSIPPPSSRE